MVGLKLVANIIGFYVQLLQIYDVVSNVIIFMTVKSQ